MFITEYRKLRRMDSWASRIRDLQDAGMTLAEIGTEVGLSTSSVGDIATGRTESPRGDAALKLHALHAAKFPKRSRSHAAA